ncbi:hypothetical protein [Actinoplanes aureus]|uniref:Uncharacterized protein n=1 Tax=Actinoplanes aureus TaxID=2792083 RepID=A0A931G0G8_9ACTN|nr:hypothetical protein [Actinoplanes aureus]MBG0565860.1 hypothetical protein [Actinoplanes aureus]
MITDDEVYGHLRDELAPVRMGPDVAAVSARGRTLRRRRRVAPAAGLAVAAVAAGLILGIPTGTPPRMESVAWSVESQPDGSVTLTVRQLQDPEGLSGTLRKAGVPAKVEFKRLGPGEAGGCAETGQVRSPKLPRVVSPEWGADEQRMTIRPDLMPPGTTLHIVIFQMPDPKDPAGHDWSAHLSLVEGEPMPCTP